MNEYICRSVAVVFTDVLPAICKHGSMMVLPVLDGFLPHLDTIAVTLYSLVFFYLYLMTVANLFANTETAPLYATELVDYSRSVQGLYLLLVLYQALPAVRTAQHLYLCLSSIST